MSVYARFKRDPDGFRKLIELLETTPAMRRQKMIDVGMAEDPVYTEKVLGYILTFEDLIHLPDLEMAELVKASPARMVGYAIAKSPPDVQSRFLKNTTAGGADEIQTYVDASGVGLREIGGAQLKLIEIARRLEKRSLIKTKRIPLNGDS